MGVFEGVLLLYSGSSGGVGHRAPLDFDTVVTPVDQNINGETLGAPGIPTEAPLDTSLERVVE